MAIKYESWFPGSVALSECTYHWVQILPQWCSLGGEGEACANWGLSKHWGERGAMT